MSSGRQAVMDAAEVDVPLQADTRAPIAIRDTTRIERSRGARGLIDSTPAYRNGGNASTARMRPRTFAGLAKISTQLDESSVLDECLVEQPAVVGAAFGRTVIVDAFAKEAGKLLSLVGRQLGRDEQFADVAIEVGCSPRKSESGSASV
jgi:hypothetical protein